MISILRSLFTADHVLHQRSVKTLMKYHYRDLADLAQRLTLYVPSEESFPPECVVEDTVPMKLPLYILCKGCVTVWKQKPGGGVNGHDS